MFASIKQRFVNLKSRYNSYLKELEKNREHNEIYNQLSEYPMYQKLINALHFLKLSRFLKYANTQTKRKWKEQKPTSSKKSWGKQNKETNPQLLTTLTGLGQQTKNIHKQALEQMLNKTKKEIQNKETTLELLTQQLAKLEEKITRVAENRNWEFLQHLGGIAFIKPEKQYTVSEIEKLNDEKTQLHTLLTKLINELGVLDHKLKQIQNEMGKKPSNYLLRLAHART